MRRYLIVDDNVAFADNLAEIIREQGAEVRIVSEGPEALDMVRSIQFDALLTDMRMPVMGGAELLRGIREIDPELPALVMTAYTSDNELANARKEGLLAILPKPVPLDALIPLLSSARRNGLVALVEDDVAFSDGLSEALRGRGFAAVTVSSVTETERLGSLKPFAALVDLRVPGGPDGEAMRKLASRFPGLPMLVMSGHAGVFPPLPHQGFFRKPFQLTALLDSLERFYQPPRAWR